jgi:type I restriction enzyme, S subunit
MSAETALSAENRLITENIDLWTSAIKAKKTQGRGSSSKRELYGIKKLRELILELAVRGKLVPQDPSDEPASVLLEKIAAEKAQLVKDKKIKRPKKLPEINDEEKLFELPNGWQWARLGNVCKKVTDGSHNPPRDTGEGYPMLSSQNVNHGKIDFSSPSRFVSFDDFLIENRRTSIKPYDILLNIVASIGRSAVVPKDAPQFVLQRSVAVLDSLLEPQYFAKLLVSPLCLSYYETHAKGTAQKGIYLGKLSLMPLVIPPKEEQIRINNKVEDLMSLCDQLEQQTEASLDAHQLLVDTLLATLTNAKDADELSESWARLSEHFDTLITTDYAVEQLKQTILQLAVMGKLVPQDPNDEPASELLKRIAAEKAQLIKDKKIKKQKPLPEITDEEKPFELPSGWEWIKFGTLSEFINGDRGKNYPNKSEYADRGVPWINTGHIELNGTLSIAAMNFITEEKFSELRSGKIRRGDLVYCLRGATFGKTAFVTPYDQGAIASSLMIIRPYCTELAPFIYRYLTSPFGRSQIFRFDNGSAQPNLSANSVMLYAFPCPPLEEQARIFAKVDQLMALCDQLRSRLNEAQTTQLQLADTVVDEALN